MGRQPNMGLPELPNYYTFTLKIPTAMFVERVDNNRHSMQFPLESQSYTYGMILKTKSHQLLREMRILVFSQKYCHVKWVPSPWLGTSSGCRWSRQPPNMEGSCKHIE
jgi:hypothetical protein